MKKFPPALILGLLVAVPTVGLAQAPAAPAPTAAPSVTISATGAVASQYMFRGMRMSSAAFQPTVEVAAGDLTLGAWGNFPFDGKKVPDSSDPEIDLYGSYTMTIEKNVTFAPGFTTYVFPRAPTDAGFYRTTFEPNVALSVIVDDVKLTPKVCYDMVLKGFTYELTAYYALPLKQIGSELDFTGVYGTYKWKEFANHATPDVKAWGDYWWIGAAMPFQIDAKSKVTIGIAYSEGTKAYTKAGSFGKTPNSLAIGRGVATIGYTRTF
jgi:uncharacterized protein (TIGR02001 family)